MHTMSFIFRPLYRTIFTNKFMKCDVIYSHKYKHSHVLSHLFLNTAIKHRVMVGNVSETVF